MFGRLWDYFLVDDKEIKDLFGNLNDVKKNPAKFDEMLQHMENEPRRTFFSDSWENKYAAHAKHVFLGIIERHLIALFHFGTIWTWLLNCSDRLTNARENERVKIININDDVNGSANNEYIATKCI